jgi:hypothetical protein
MDALLAPIEGADHHEVGSITVDVVRAANGRIKRLVYPPGFRWSTHLKPLVGTVLCMYAHVGFLARGHIRGEYADGCAFEFIAPQVVVVEPRHDAWFVGDERRYSSSSMPKRQRRASSGSPRSTAISHRDLTL